MGKIKVLPETLSTKIAAGEVVERPASVVKELMENSIDAGATEVFVTVAEGGRRMIKIRDNGTGLAREDAALSIVRHATSKVSTEADLDRISTMGFRGEALPSIASVSRFTLITKMRGERAGTSIRVEGGGEAGINDEGAPDGTTVTVRDLFFNTPARAKFLRTAQTEYGRILDVFKWTALARPEVRFRLVQEFSKGSSRPVETRGAGLREGVGDIYGRNILKELKEVSLDVDAGTGVKGLVGTPALTFPTSKRLFTYVNGRFVRDRGVIRAVADAYSGTVEPGRYPFAVIFIRIPFEEVDVNVHPAKTEVRFRRPSFVFDIVKAAVRGAVGSGSLSFDGGGARAEVRVEKGPDDIVAPSARPIPVRTPAGGPGALGVPQRHFQQRAREVRPAYREEAPAPALAPTLGFAEKDEAIVNPEFLTLEMVGQIFGEFIVAESATGGEFYLIDQHGAAERTRFERLKKLYYGTKAAPSQYLLVPERIETSPGECEALKGSLALLEKLGFEVVPFGPSFKQGGETFVIKAAPDILEGSGLGRLIKDLAEELAEKSRTTRVEEKIEGVLMRIACHSVVRGPRTLTKVEARALFTDLAAADLAGHCPHGRPVVKRVSRNELEAMFKRR